MKYFHRTSITPDQAVAAAATYFGARMNPMEEGVRRRRFASAIGKVTVSVEAEGGHYTLITVETDQPGESEIDKVAKRFLTEVHASVDSHHVVRGAY
jgi:hypothetical protein